MKRIFVILLVIVSSSFAFAQQAQKGLLWKITGNNLSKPSYIYGNMHVSEKIAFHLGEEFFEAISSVEKIALESNPIVLLDEIMESELASNYIGRFNIKYQTDNGFYKESFKLSVPKNRTLAAALSSDHYFKNWLLYRENKSRTDFEEETFLDMFIYQAGAKNKKEVLSLEDFKQTTHYMKLASIPDIDKKEPSKWFKKLTKNKSYIELLEDAYRNQDLSMIDSLNMNIGSENHLIWMLYKRNEIMAHNIDSIVQSGTSLFSGVGAAHLPGEKGMLQLLEKMGYTLKPIDVTFSDKARDLREQFDKKKLPPKEYFTFKSELFSVKVPVKLYETPYYSSQRQFFGPELTNGSFFVIKQISTYALLKGMNIEKNFIKIDSLLFENIPGKIESKKTISGEFYKGFDILNKTKSGDYQRYRIYITPMNIFVFKMGGKDDFVKSYGGTFFNSIELKKPDEKWVKVSPINNDFEVNLPDYYSINFNQKVTSLYGQTVLEACNTKDSSYYFLKRKTLYDWIFIEEDDFESKRIAEQFFLKMNLDTVKATVVKDSEYPTAIAHGKAPDSTHIAVKVIINGPFYYMLVARSKQFQETNNFFDSFKFKDFKYNFDFKKKVDSGMFFSVNSNYLLPEDFTYTRKKAYEKQRNKNNTEDNEFRQDINTSVYYSETYERVNVKTKKFHYYHSVENIDSLWQDEIEIVSIDEDDEVYFIVKNKRKATEDSCDVLYVTYADTNSSRVIYTKYILKHGLLYRIKAVLDSSEKMSKYISSFFNTFQPSDTLMGHSIFEDKASLFFNSIYGTDDLAKERALKSVEYIKFKKKDIDSLKLTIATYNFPAKHIEAKKRLIHKLISIKDYDAVDYAVKLYKEVGDTAMFQMAILNALGWRASSKSVKAYLKLLDYDIPISGNKWNSGYLVYPFRYSLGNKKAKAEVFPELLNYTFINKYREIIIETLAKQVDSNFISPKSYKKSVNQLLREAKIVLKEQISYEQSERADEDDHNGYSYYSRSYKYKQNNLLVDYATILLPFYDKNNNVKDFIDRFDNLDNYTIKTEIYCKIHKRFNIIDTSKWNALARDPVNLAFLYKQMEEYDILEQFPKSFINQKEFAISLLFSTGFNFKKDSMEFIGKRFASNGKESGWVYFFKTKQKNDDDWELNYIGFQPTDTLKVSVDETVTEQGENIDKSLEMEEIITEIINIISLEKHPHADASERRRYDYY